MRKEPPIDELIGLNKRISRRLYMRDGMVALQTMYYASLHGAGWADHDFIRMPACEVKSLHAPDIIKVYDSETKEDNSRTYYMPRFLRDWALTENELALVLGRDFITMPPAYRTEENLAWVNAQFRLMIRAIQKCSDNAYILGDVHAEQVIDGLTTPIRMILTPCEYCTISKKVHDKLCLRTEELESRINAVEEERK